MSKPVEYHRMVEPWSSEAILVRMIDVWQSKPRVCTVSGLKNPNIFQANVIVLVRVILSAAIGDNNLRLAKYAS